MASFEEIKSKGNECFKQGKFELALEFYAKALDISPSNHVVLSNRSLVFYKLGKYQLALEEADKCTKAHDKWAKGYARKASALNALGMHTEAKKVCVKGFILLDQSLCKVFVEEWLKASRSLVNPKFNALKEPPWSDVIPQAADLFCDDYCDLLFTVTYQRLSDSQSMSHNMMVECVSKGVKIAENVLSEFCHPLSPSLQEWAETAVIRFESHPKSEVGKLMGNLQMKVAGIVEWLKNSVHESLRQILDPILILILSAMLVRGNILCQAYTGFLSTEYLGYACVAFFEQGILMDPKYIAFHLAVLSMILNSYRLRGALDDSEVDLIRGLCHKLECLLPHLPKDHKNYDLIKEHYLNTVKVFREICAKVITGFKGSHDPREALSELEQALLKCDENPDMAMDMAVKYITDIANKSKASETGSIDHINFIDAENMLYVTGILAKLGQHDQALRIFHSGESMVLSLIATLMEKDIVSLDELPAVISNCRKLALSGAIWLKDHFPKEAADVFLHWKSLFSEIRAVLIRIGMRNCYREVFETIEKFASEGTENKKTQVLDLFQAQERDFLKKFSLPIIKALCGQSYDSVSEVLQGSDVAIDYTFNIYNPEHHNPPQSQACAVVIQPKKQPMLFSLPNDLVYDLLRKLPKTIYKMWLSESKEFEDVTKALSDILFPEPIRKLLLNPKIARVFISPDVDLMCFPIDQLPLHNDSDGSTLPLYERFSISILSSPRELVRDATIHKLQSSDSSLPASDFCDKAKSDPTVSTLEENRTSKQKQEELSMSSICTSGGSSEDMQNLTEGVADLQLSHSNLKCFIIANPDFKLECTGKSPSSWKQLLESFGGLFGLIEEPQSHQLLGLEGTQEEAEAVYRYLSANPSFQVHRPITMKDATISAVLNIQSPHILHLATHGYTSKQENTPYHGNFWKDESSGIILAGAQTFLDKKFEKMDVKAGTGHMNSIAMCGMQLEQTRLVFISTCDSSVGSRPAQEMPDSITQALRAAGAQTVISTLWIVQDSEATEFISCFYEHLMTYPNCRPSNALSHAKVAMRQKGKSMFHWGAYICHGIDHPISMLSMM